MFERMPSSSPSAPERRPSSLLKKAVRLGQKAMLVGALAGPMVPTASAHAEKPKKIEVKSQKETTLDRIVLFFPGKDPLKVRAVFERALDLSLAEARDEEEKEKILSFFEESVRERAQKEAEAKAQSKTAEPPTSKSIEEIRSRMNKNFEITEKGVSLLFNAKVPYEQAVAGAEQELKTIRPGSAIDYNGFATIKKSKEGKILVNGKILTPELRAQLIQAQVEFQKAVNKYRP